jgi:hypothetical protein
MKILLFLLFFPAAVQAQALDCSFQGEDIIQLRNGALLTMRHVMNPVDETLTVELVYEGQGWISLGFSHRGRMTGSYAVIGLPDRPVSATNPGKYYLEGETANAVWLMSDAQQTLTDTSLMQNETHTTMKFTKPLAEVGELAISATAQNTFIYATGFSNQLGLHNNDGSSRLVVTPCRAVSESAASTMTIVDSSATSNTGNTLSEIVVEPTAIEDPPAGSHSITANAQTNILDDKDEDEESGESDEDSESVSDDSESDSEDSESDSEDSESDSEDIESDSEDSFGTDLSFLNQGGSTRQLWIWHGILMSVSWSILVPLAIGSSMLRDTLCLAPGVWLTIHLTLNMFAIMCMIVSFGIAVYATNANTMGGEDPNPFSDLKHRTIGLVIFLLAFVQAASGLMRPSGPKKPATPVEVPKDVRRRDEMVNELSDKSERTHRSNDDSSDDEVSSNEKTSGKSIARRIWEYKHRMVGLGLLGLSWYNCDSGLDLFAERYGENNDLSGAFWGVTGGLAGLICILYAVQIARH